MRKSRLYIKFLFPLLALHSSTGFAGGSIGLDYFSTDISIAGIRGNLAEVRSEGPGISLGWSPNDHWSINLSRAVYDGTSVVSDIGSTQATIIAEDETVTNGLTIAYFGENTWISLGVSQTEGNQTLIGQGQANQFLDIEDSQDTTAITLETGYEWNLENWSPSISVFLTQLKTDITRGELLDTLNIYSDEQTEESLSGTDIGVSGTLTYYYGWTESVLLAPSFGLFYQTNIRGELEGETSYTFSNNTRNFDAANTYRGDFGAPDEINGNLNINLLVGDWIWSGGYISALSSNESGDSWFIGLNYLF